MTDSPYGRSRFRGTEAKFFQRVRAPVAGFFRHREWSGRADGGSADASRSSNPDEKEEKMHERSFGLSPAFGLRREIDRLFDDAFVGRGSAASWLPAVDIHETSKELRLDVELPGVREEDVELEVENGTLTIRGQKSAERKEESEEGRFHLVERTYGSFFRSFQLPPGIDEKQIHADYDQGVLHIRIPKAALPQPRRIQIGGVSGERARAEEAGPRHDDRGARRGGATEKKEGGRDRMVAEPRGSEGSNR
jgi:HSP20 family protein